MNSVKNDIQSIDDIKILVDTFYDRVREDKLIGPIFDKKIGDRWPQHLAKMYTFWQTVLLEEHTYFGSPFPPHANLPVDKEHFERWLSLFSETIYDLYEGPVANEAMWRANKMAEMFQIKINHFRNNSSKSLI